VKWHPSRAKLLNIGIVTGAAVFDLDSAEFMQ